MTALPEMRDLAQRLLSYEADGRNTSGSMESSILAVYDKLRKRLGELAGSAGFQALASRALTLARSEVPGLSAVEVAADGSLEGMNATGSPADAEKNRAHEGGVVLIPGCLDCFLFSLAKP